MIRMLFIALIVCLVLSGNCNAVQINPAPPIYKTFDVFTSFEKELFFDRKILNFTFVKGNWKLEFDSKTKSFKPITDLLLIETNLPAADIDSEKYILSMSKNESICTSASGGIGTKDFSSVFVNIDGEFEEVKELNTDIGGELSFQTVGRTGLYSEHEVMLTFSPIQIGKDKICAGFVKMQLEIGV